MTGFTVSDSSVFVVSGVPAIKDKQVFCTLPPLLLRLWTCYEKQVLDREGLSHALSKRLSDFGKLSVQFLSDTDSHFKTSLAGVLVILT